MNDQMLQHLESCAQMLMAPTNLVSRENLKQAEEAFLEFQKTKEPFEMCRNILESVSCSPYLKYQAATCLKNSIIRDWNYLKEDGRHVQLLQYLLEYVTNHQSLGHFIREQLLLVAAILLKRIGIQESSGQPARCRLADEVKETENSIVSNVLSSILSMQCTINPSLIQAIGKQDGGAANSEEELSQNLHRMLIATQYLLAVLFEYSSSTRTSDFGIPWIKHLEAKKKFERKELKQVFTSTLDTLNSVLSHLQPLLVASDQSINASFGASCHNASFGSNHNTSGTSLPNSHLSTQARDVFMKSLELLELIFTWNFDIITIISSQYATHVDSIETPSFQPNIDWRETLINDNVIQFLFHLYIFSRRSISNNEKMVHHSLQILSQLSSLTGAIICESKIRLKFVNLLLGGLINIMESTGASNSSGARVGNPIFESYEVVAISSIIYRLSFHLQNRDTLEHIDGSVKVRLADIVTTISCEIFEGSLKLEQDKFSSDDGTDRYKQSVENICTAWSVLLQALEKSAATDDYASVPSYNCSSSSFDDKRPDFGDSLIASADKKDAVEVEMLKASARKVFTCYLKCHLTQPEGYREMVEDDDEIEDFEEDDTLNFNDQLNTIGSLARIDLGNAIDDLSNLLLIRMNQLQAMVATVVASRPDVNDNNNTNLAPPNVAAGGNTPIGSHEWCCLNEDVHWLILISSWTLSQSTWLGDRDLIPDAITALSIATNADTSVTLTALKSLEITPANIHSVDPVVRLIIILLKYVQMEQYSIESNLHILSPEVSATLSIFVSKFMSVYLMPREDSYKEMSLNLISCFGKDTPSSGEILDFLLKHLLIKISFWSTEPTLREETASSLVQFVKESKERADAVCKSVQLNKLLVPLFANQLQCYTVGTRKSLYQLIVLLASSNHAIYENLFQSLRIKYQTIQSLIKSQDDLNELNRLSLTELCDCLIGITHACNPDNSVKLWNELLGVIYVNEVPKLMEMYRNYNLVIASLLEFVQSVTARVLCFLPTKDTLKFYEASVKILQIYAKSNRGRFTNEATTLEETSTEIVLILQMLNDLSSKDFIDWFPPPPSSKAAPSVASPYSLASVTEEADCSDDISATQIVFLGLNIVLPLMTPQLLQFPDLSVNYYKLVTYLCEDADRLLEVPESLLDSLMLSLQHALKSTFSSDIKCSCLSTIYVLTEHALRSEAKGLTNLRSVATKLEPFLEVIFTMIIEEQGSTRDVLLREHVANCLFSLIKCFLNSYQALIERLIKSQVTARPNETTLESDLRACFNNLVTPTNDAMVNSTNLSRIPHRTLNSVQGLVSFRQRFEVTISQLLGLLRIK